MLVFRIQLEFDWNVHRNASALCKHAIVSELYAARTFYGFSALNQWHSIPSPTTVHETAAKILPRGDTADLYLCLFI